MSKIISIHSYRGGTGKSNTTANLAALIAAQGFRVGVVDTDLNSPGIHVPFGLDLEDENVVGYTLNDYLWGNCEIKDTAYEVTKNLDTAVSGHVFLVPASIKAGEITRLLKDGYDVALLNEGFDDLITALDLDVLLVDTHPGLSNETLLSIAITDVLIIILRPDHQDYQGTAVTVQVARKLDVLEMMLIVNKLPTVYDFSDVKRRVENLYSCEVAAMLPHSDEMMALASQGVFVLRYPNHVIARELAQLAARLVADLGA
ncbi:MAG: MinD/ParA family protein [Chloroflexota bacterium]|nr:MinD/ParA family protein [Anaerolineales bacterium]MCA9975727.1 MinD/ParA family protein [Anaerolineales bacterium]MCB8966907.1 MinD/ParA family protein [Ardenticatenaceae bacterium]